MVPLAREIALAASFFARSGEDETPLQNQPATFSAPSAM
jgi:hypothetical protein